MPAPHHYLEALRNRLTAAVLDARLDSVSVEHSYVDQSAEADAHSQTSYFLGNSPRVTMTAGFPCLRVSGEW